MFWDRAILTLAVAQTLVWAGTFYVFPALLLWWEADLGWARAELMLAMTVSILMAGVSSPVAGRLIDQGYGASMMGCCTAISGLSLIGLAVTQSLWQFYCVWALIGVSSAGCLYDPCFALITRVRGETARRGITWITLIAGFASTLSFPATYALADALGWRVALVWIGCGVVGGVAPLMWFGARALGSQTAPISREPVNSGSTGFLHQGYFWMLGFAFATAALVQGALVQHLLPILSERAVPSFVAVAAAGSIGAMQVVGRLAMMMFENRISANGFVYIAFGVMAAAVLILGLAGSQALWIGCFVVLFGSAYGTISILRPVVARSVLGQRHFGAKSGYLSLIYMFCAAGSGYFGALVWSSAGYSVLLLLLAGLSASGMVLYARARVLASRRLA